MAKSILVTVTYDPQQSSLIPDQQEIELLSPDTWVQWQIAEGSLVPAGASLEILFTPPLGPFQTVQSFDNLNLAAKGNKGPNGAESSVFPYFLYLIPSSPTNQNLATGGPFTVKNLSQEPNASPWLTVTYSETRDEHNEPQRHVSLEPQQLLLFEGDVAFWKVVGLSPDHVVAFRFNDPPHFPGPFPTYFATREGGHGNSRLGIANFGSVTGQRNYVVEIWDQNGHFLASTTDPSVDSLGRPPGLGGPPNTQRL